MKNNIEDLIQNLNASFHGGAWHGPSLLEHLKGLKFTTAGYRISNIHTIAELIYHITSWRLFAIKKIQGDALYNIDSEKKNFGDFKKIDEFELETLMMELTLSQDELVKALENKEDIFLDEIVPGAEYTFDTLLHGIIQHDIYHSGQIAIIKKIVKSFSKPEENYLEDSRFFDRDTLNTDYY